MRRTKIRSATHSRRSSRRALAACATTALTLAIGLFASTSLAGRSTVACRGDCDGNAQVTIDELLSGVSIALGSSPVDRCPSLDANTDQSVAVDELTTAVGEALVGCPTMPNGDTFDGFRRADVEYLADDDLDGRDNGTEGSRAAQAYLIDQIRGFTVGYNPSAIGDDAYKQSFAGGTNIIGIIPGSQSPDEYVVVGAHYDHFGGCRGVCNGATDNVAGTAAVLAVAREIADNPFPPRRSVVIVFWDREEDGLLGSRHYIENPPIPRAKTIAYVNFDIQGANLLPSLRRISFAVAPETGGPRLRQMVANAIDGVDLDTRPLSAIFGQGRSDYFHFVNARIPTVFFSDSTGPCYHTPGDNPEIVDYGKLAKQSEIGAKLVEDLANTFEIPKYVRSAVSFQDAATLDEVLRTAMVDLDRFSAADQAAVMELSTKLSAVVAKGEANFTPTDVGELTVGTIRVVEILTNQTCDGFLEAPTE